MPMSAKIKRSFTEVHEEVGAYYDSLSAVDFSGAVLVIHKNGPASIASWQSAQPVCGSILRALDLLRYSPDEMVRYATAMATLTIPED